MNQLYNVVRHIDFSEFDVHIVALSKSQSSAKVSDFKSEQCDISTLDLERVPNPLVVRRRFRDIIQQIQPDIIHSHGFRSDLLSAVVSPKATTVSTLHSYHYKHHPLKYGRLFGRMMAWSHIHSLKRIDIPIACSQYVSNQVKKHSLLTEVIRNGVNRMSYEPVSDSEQTEIRHELDIPEYKDMFVSVGSLNERKDPITVIEGFSDLSIKDAKLLLLGDGPLLDLCQRKTADIPSIEVLGYQSSVKKYLQAADCFVSASRYEGFPMAVLEALSSGLPVCLSDIDPHCEVLEYDHRAGTLFPCGDANGLADAMEALLDGGLDERSSAARGIIESELNSERMSNQYQNLYRDATGSDV